MIRIMLPAAVLMLAACSGGEDEKSGPEASANLTPLREAAPAEPAVAPETVAQADEPEPVDAPLKKVESTSDAGGKAIPATIRGRWGLVAADCTSTKGDAKGLLTIDATNLRFYESHGELVRVREHAANRIVADYKFSGEGMEWDQQMLLDVRGDGKTLIRRDYGEGASGPMRYTRCAA